MDASSQNKKIFILEFAEEFSGSLRNFLLKSGYNSQVIPRNEDLEKLTQDQDIDYFFIALCGSNEKQCITNIQALLEIDILFNFPMLVIGREAHLYEAILNRSFSVSVPLSYPYKNDDIILGLKFLERLLNRRKNALKKQEELMKASQINYGDPKAISNLIFNHFLTLGIEDKNFYGEIYTKSFLNCSDLGEEHLPLKNKKAMGLINTLCDKSSDWGKKHLHRVSFLTTLILQSLPISDELKERAKIASFLFATTMIESKSNLFKMDCLGNQSISYKEKIEEEILSTNDKLTSTYQLTEISDILLCMADLIKDEEIIDNSELSIVASAILLSDIVDKACWQGISWNPRAGYRIFNTFKKGQFVKRFHPAPVCCILKILSEALLSTSHKFYLDDSTSNDPMLIKDALDTKKYVPKENEERIKISSLVNGMKLSQPLKAFDGKQILNADLVLDNDLIWRIWQLSAIKPLNAPVIVKRNKRNSILDLGKN